MRAVILLLITGLLAGCAFRGNLVRIPVGIEPATTRAVYFATNRDFDELPFGALRSKGITYGLTEVSIPPSHEPGEIEWPRGTPDPQKHFLLSKTDAYASAAEFRQKMNAELRKRKPGDRDIVIFVHGFNNTFGDGVYRLAQMAHDLEVPGIAVNYSWPSAGSPLGYAYDRDSALFARDGLEELIDEASKTNAESVIIVAHSLGSFVTMESLRQLKLRGKTRQMSRLGGVLLMSPDVDLDVFRKQADAIGKLPQPFVIFSSQKDRALRLIERLTGQKNRLGKLEDVSEIADYDVTYIDVTAFDDGALNHFSTARSPALIKLLNQIGDFDAALSGDAGSRAGLLPGTILTIQNTTSLILRPIR